MDTKKHEVDENGNVKKRFEVLSIKSLTNHEILQWENGELEYMTIIEE